MKAEERVEDLRVGGGVQTRVGEGVVKRGAIMAMGRKGRVDAQKTLPCLPLVDPV